MYSTSSLVQGTTSFSIHKNDVPITILPPDRPHTQSNPNLTLHQSLNNLQQNASDTRSELLPPDCLTSGRTTTFDVHYLPSQQQATEVFESMSLQNSTSNGLSTATNRPLRVPQPPKNLHNSLLMKPHCKTPSTSSFNSTTTTFPIGTTNPPSTSSLPVYQSPPVGGRRQTPSNSTLPAYNTFATSTLPNRRFPQLVNDSRHSFNAPSTTNSMSRADLMELAKRRQHQIEANEDFIDELQKQQHALMLAKRNGLNVKDEVDRLRGEIRRDEQNLQQIGAIKRDCIQTRNEMQNQRQVLQTLQNESHAKDIELRQAAGKLQLLQRRDLMNQRRIAAENAALAQMNAMQRGKTVEELYGEVRKPQQRPKASVVPFQVQRQPPQSQSPQTVDKRKLPPSYDEIDAARNFNRVVMRPQVQGRYSSSSINHHANDNNSPWVLRASAVDTVILRNDSLKAAKRRSWAHVDQQNSNILAASSNSTQSTSQVPVSTKTQPAPSVPATTTQSTAQTDQQQPAKKQRKNHNLLSSFFGRKKESSSASKQKATVAPIKEAAKTTNKEIELPKQAPLIEKPINATVESSVEATKEPKEEVVPKLQQNEVTIVEQPVAKIEPAVKVEQSVLKVEELVKEEILPDPPAPTNTQTTNASTEKSTTSKSEPVCTSVVSKVPNRMESVSPPEDPQHQQKERCESPATSVESNQDEKAMSNDEKRMLEATHDIIRQLNSLDVDSIRVISAPKARLDSDEDLDEDSDDSDKDLYRMQHDVLIQPYDHHLDDYGNEDEQQTSTEEASSNDGEASVEEPQFEEIMRPELRSCLKPAGVEKAKRTMRFDPWIIFLNAALEGQLDLVKDNAKRIKDVSQANEEGITALHNSICAGHYEIVKYLVAEHADVNAQDSDGWTPLHCAASCNNLPIAKLLIENGACVFATSLSDSETPAQKCEEAIKATQDVGSPSNVYDKCFAYLETVEQCFGVINDGKVFAVFGYEAEREDELSFEEGDVLKVLKRETGERGICGQRQTPYDFMYQIQLPLSEDCLWWLCENQRTGQTGLVPRNFLSLYPLWKHRPADWKTFELPSSQQALEALLKQNVKIDDETKDTRRDSNATLDPCDGDGSCSPDSSNASDDVRVEDSPPPLSNSKDFDASVQISAHA